MKNNYLKIITSIVFISILNSGYVLGNAINENIINYFNNQGKTLEQIKQDKEAEEREIIIFYVFISGTAILILLASHFGLKYIKKNKTAHSNDTEG